MTDLMKVASAARARTHDGVADWCLAQMTSFTTDDIVLTLQHLGLLRYINGSHVISIAPELVDDKWRRLVSPGWCQPHRLSAHSAWSVAKPVLSRTGRRVLLSTPRSCTGLRCVS